MIEFPIDINYLWLSLGILLIALEAMGMSGLGLFFAGLGAATTATLIYYNVIGVDAYFTQFVAFLASGSLWALLLWKPLQARAHRKGPEQFYSNIIGEEAVVAGSGLKKGAEGTVTWSGTQMRAELSPAARADVSAGARVKIVDVRGNKLIVDVINA